MSGPSYPVFHVESTDNECATCSIGALKTPEMCSSLIGRVLSNLSGINFSERRGFMWGGGFKCW